MSLFIRSETLVAVPHRIPIDARVALIGFPSVGKSTLLSKVTKTESITGAYEFTTLTVRLPLRLDEERILSNHGLEII